MEGKKVAIVSTVASILCASVIASAQEPGAAPAAAPRPAAAPAADPPGETDHDKVVGHLGVGFLGTQNVPIAAMGGGLATATAPVVGVRYWLMPNLGIDAGLGLGWFNSSTTTNAGGMSASVDNPSPLAFVLHGGVPIALAHSGHFTFEVVPELNFGYATETIKMMPPAPNVTLSGVQFNVGGRVGAEIQFGFIGIPQLSLEGSVGLLFNYTQVKADAGNGNNISTNATSLATTLGTGNPWGIFTNSVFAIYYL